MLYGELPEVTLESGEAVNGLTVRILNPPKSATLRLPTNPEMLDRLSRQRSIRRSLGRRKSQTESVPNAKADLALFERIRLDKGVEFDEFEAAKAVGRITSHELTGCERHGEVFEIGIKTPFGATSHTLGIPFERDLAAYRRVIVDSTDLPHGQEELRYNHDAAAKLYDAVVVKAEGYAPGVDVPPHHKFSAVVELVNALDDLDPPNDPNL